MGGKIDLVVTVSANVHGLEISVRLYEPEDAAALAEVMWQSVRVVALADYSVEQAEA